MKMLRKTKYLNMLNQIKELKDTNLKLEKELKRYKNKEKILKMFKIS